MALKMLLAPKEGACVLGPNGANSKLISDMTGVRMGLARAFASPREVASQFQGGVLPWHEHAGAVLQRGDGRHRAARCDAGAARHALSDLRWRRHMARTAMPL